MTKTTDDRIGAPPARKLPKAERRQQLLDTALAIIREEGADGLTLGRLAARAGVTKPVAYDHFGTRTGLLIELYRWIDTERVDAFQEAMAHGQRSVDEAVEALAAAFIECATDRNGQWQAVGAALAGSQEKDAVSQELLDHSVHMFVAVLKPHSTLASAELERRCVGLVGAGESLSAAVVRGKCGEPEAVEALSSLIRAGLGSRTG